MRNVRGILFLDYVRILRRSGAKHLSTYLSPEDLILLGQQIDLGTWYPMDTFERFGLAILGEVVGRDVDAIRRWGHSQIPPMLSFFPGLCADADPRDTIIRFGNLMGSLFDFDAVTVEAVDDASASIRIAYGMSAAAEEAASWQTLGFFEALVEAAGGVEVEGTFIEKGWERPKWATALELSWSRPPPKP